MSDKDREDAEAAARIMATAEDGRCNASPTSPEPPKRRFLQMHLSTGIVMMIAASVLIGLNVVPRDGKYGWPWPAAGLIYSNRPRIIADVFVCAVILLQILVLTDWFFRRRDRSRSPEEPK